MPIWELEPGCERPIPREELDMPMQGIGSLTPQEAATRAERWFGARVDYGTTGKIKIYPKDPTKPMITISDRWLNGNDRRNAVSRLQRHGLDVINGQTPPDSIIRPDGRSIDPHLTRKIEIPTEKDEPVTTVEPTRNGQPTPAVMPAKVAAQAPTHEDYQTLLGMLAQAEGRITELTGRMDALTNRVTRLDDIEHQNRARYARIVKQIQETEKRIVAATGPVPEDPAAQAERERAELTEKAVALLESLPPAATMTAGSLAASLGVSDKGNLLGKLMATAAKEERVTLLKVGSQKLYRALPRSED